MNNTKAEKISGLVTLLKKADRAYHAGEDQIMSDYDYDMSKLRLRKLAPQHPYLATVGKPTKSTEGHTRDKAMGSLNNVRNAEEILEWVEKHPHDSYIMSPKIDGLALDLVYRDHELVGGYTRGDGVTGEDVSSAVVNIPTIPKFLAQDGLWNVRGEVYVDFATFKKINELAIEAGEDEYTLPRAVASGLLKSGRACPEFAKDCFLRFRAWELVKGSIKVMRLRTEEERLFCVKQRLEIPTVPVMIVQRRLLTAECIENTLEKWAEMRKAWKFPTDGICLSCNNVDYIERGRHSNGTPQGKTAYKFPPAVKVTTVLSIIPQVGRTGKITPVVWFKPVILEGSEVQKANLHNYNEAKRLKVSVGAIIAVEKACDIIPQVNRTMKESTTPLKIPELCPMCKNPLKVVGENLFCVNDFCESQICGRLKHFCKTLGMLGFGGQTINTLAPQLTKLSDLFTNGRVALVKAEQSQHMASKLYNEILEAREQSFHKLLEAIGMKSVGEDIAKKIAKTFKTPEELAKYPTASQLRLMLQAEGVLTGPILTERVPVMLEKHMDEILDLAKVMHIKAPTHKKGGCLTGKVFFVTGSVEVPRKTLKDMIEQAGGELSESLSSKVDYFIMGEGGKEHKRVKAITMSVPVIGYDIFKQMFETGNNMC